MDDWCVLAAVAVLAMTGVGHVAGASAGGNEPPLAEAGLDQTVQRGATVYLDGGGSVDPDGTIDQHRWVIETPAGNEITPACPTCPVTRFDATSTGEYAVTLTVTDSDGATRSDTMYVTVTEPVAPNVSLSGPDTSLAGTEVTFTATAEGDEASLDRLVWLDNGTRNRTVDLDAPATTTETTTRTFDSPGNYTVGAFVVDMAGWTATAEHTVTVIDETTSSSGGGDGDSCQYVGPHNVCQTGGADFTVQMPGGETKVVDTNGKPGIQLYDNQKGKVVTYMSEEALRNHNNGVDLDTANEHYEQRQQQQQKFSQNKGSESSNSMNVINDIARNNDNVCSGVCGGGSGGSDGNNSDSGNNGGSSGSYGSGYGGSSSSGGSSDESSSDGGSSNGYGGYGSGYGR
ncbi:MAG: PKD domain-containing protein [Haloarculaceae archaeon]